MPVYRGRERGRGRAEDMLQRLMEISAQYDMPSTEYEPVPTRQEGEEKGFWESLRTRYGEQSWADWWRSLWAQDQAREGESYTLPKQWGEENRSIVREIMR